MEEPEVETRQQQWGEFEAKWAEAANTAVMPPEAGGRPAKPQLPIKKSGSAEPPDDTLDDPTTGEQAAKNPQSGLLNPRVSVAGKEPPKVIKEKQAQYLALPAQGLYPLDSYSDVKQASAYFGEWRSSFSPQHRHEFCSNLVKRASALDIEVSDEILKYGAATYASSSEVEICLDARRSLLLDEGHGAVLDKLAGTRLLVDPEVFAEALHEFDKLAGIDVHYDGEIPDPYYSTFGMTKLAADADKSWVFGNDVIYAKNLCSLAAGDSKALKAKFGDDFVKEFKKDPVGIFDSMPVDQKKIIGRLSEPTENP